MDREDSKANKWNKPGPTYLIWVIDEWIMLLLRLHRTDFVGQRGYNMLTCVLFEVSELFKETWPKGDKRIGSEKQDLKLQDSWMPIHITISFRVSSGNNSKGRRED